MIAEGTPEQVAENQRSYTGGYSKPLLEKGKRAEPTELELDAAE